MGLKRKIIAVSLCLIMMLSSINVNVIDAKASSFTLKATANNSANDGLGAVDLDWSSYSKKNVMFKGYQSKDGGKTWQTISLMDYTSIKEIKVLQIYPVEAAKGQLKTWMETNGYGKEIIKVDSVSLDLFNADPNTYLKDSSGNWKYDVIFFGTWDSNGGASLAYDLTSSSAMIVGNYINDGKGVILGHDTISTSINHNNFSSLAHYFDIDIPASFNYQVSTQVKIEKKGLFTAYPWNIGEVGTILTIPSAICKRRYLAFIC